MENYILELKDTYGDGGVKGNIKNLINNKLILNFDFNNGTYNRLNFNIKNSIEEKEKYYYKY